MKRINRTLLAIFALCAATAPSQAVAEDAYIQSTGSVGSVINTGYYMKSTSKIEVDYQYIVTSGTTPSVFGEWSSTVSGETPWKCTAYWNGSNFGVAIAATTAGTYQFATTADTDRHTLAIDIPNTTVKYDGTTKLTTFVTTGTVDATVPLGLFGRMNDTTTSNGCQAKVKIYSFKIYDSGVLVHNFIPAVKGGVAGMYDTRADAFKSAIAPATLTAGGVGVFDCDAPYVSTTGNNFNVGLTNYFDTGYIPVATTRLELDFAVADDYPQSGYASNHDWYLFDSRGYTTARPHFNMYYNRSQLGFCSGGAATDWPILKSGKLTAEDTRVRRTAILDNTGYAALFQNGVAIVETNDIGVATANPGQTTLVTLKLCADRGLTSGGAYRIYGCKIYERDANSNLVLVRDFVPCSTNGVSGLMENVNHTFHPALSAASGSTTANVPFGGDSDPFIVSNGSQFMNTGYRPGPKTKFEIDFQLTATNKSYDVLFGYYNSDCSFLLYHPVSDPYFKLCAKDETYKNSNMTPPVPQDLLRHKAVIDMPVTNVAMYAADGTLQGQTNFAGMGWAFTRTSEYPLTLFGSCTAKDGSAASQCTNAKIFGAKIWESDDNGATYTLVHDYVPAVRPQGATEHETLFESGFYDNVTGEWLFNAKSADSLGAGGAVNVVNDDYIESFGTYAFSSGCFFNPKSLVEVDYALTGGCTNYLVRGIEMGGAAVEANGLAITNESDGAIWVKGEATASTTFYISSGSVSEGSIPDTAWQKTLPAGKYIVSGISQDGIDIGVSLRLLYRSGSSASRYVSVVPYEGLAIDNSDGAYSEVALCIYVPNGATCQSDDVRGVKFLPIIRRFGDNVEQARLLGADKDTGDDNCTTRFAYYINRSGNMSFLYADTAQGSGVTLSTAKKNDTRRHTAIFDAAAGKARYVTGGKTEWTGAVDTSKIAETATNPIGVFADCMNADGTVFSAGSYTAARIYRLKISEVEGGVTNLVHDFVPEKRNGVPGMLDQVTGEFIAGADQDRACGAFEIGGDNAAAAANGDAYVESSGVSCMNSRFLMNPDAKIEVDFAMVDVETDTAGQYDAGLHYQQRVFAADSGGNALMTGLYVNNDHNFSFSLGNRLADGGAVTNGFVGFSTGIPADTRRHKAIVDAYGKTLSLETEGTTVWSNALTEFFETNYTATATFPIALFGNCNNAPGTSFRAGNPYEKSKSRIYGVKIWQAGVLVHNYKPRVKGGMAGFYDSVDGAFITGENVASFWAGGNVERVDDDPYVATPGNNIKKGGLYVDTGYFAKPSTRFELDYAILEPYRGRYSDGSTSGNGDWFLFSGYGGGSAYFHFYYNHDLMGWGAGKTSWANIGGDGLGNHTWTNSPVNVRRTVVLDQPGGKASVVTAGYTNYTATISNPGDYSASSVKIAAWYRLNGGYAPMKIYGVRIYEDGALVHAFEPRLNNGTVAGLYDTVTHVFASAGDEAAIPDEDKSGDALSYGGPVAGVDTDAYLESFGAQAIDTGYKPNPKSRFEIDYALTDVTAAGQMRPFSNNGGKTWAEFYVQGTAGTAGSTMAFGWGDSWTAIAGLVNRDTTRRQAVLDLATGEYGITGGKNSDTDPVVKPTISKESSNSLNIFDKNGTAIADSSKNNVPAKMKLYSFRIYETDGGVRTLLHEYLPYCGPDENGVVVTSLWDTVEGKALAPVLASGADPFSIGGMGWYGSGSKFHITLPEESRVRKGGTRLFAYAPGAYRYEWTCDGVAVSGGENGELLVPYDHAKACNITTNTYTATAYYMVNGSEVKGTTTSADLVFKYNGVFINYK